jgi:hypothetical protein
MDRWIRTFMAGVSPIPCSRNSPSGTGIVRMYQRRPAQASYFIAFSNLIGPFAFCPKIYAQLAKDYLF